MPQYIIENFDENFQEEDLSMMSRNITYIDFDYYSERFRQENLNPLDEITINQLPEQIYNSKDFQFGDEN